MTAVRGVFAVALTALSVSSRPAGAELSVPLFQWPVDCRRGVECLVQQYPDLDVSSGVSDPACGSRAYDGHQGVDIRLISFADLRRDVRVLAAADGVVLRLRDAAPERVFADGRLTAPLTDVPDCGNGLVIRHARGFETQYCHLRRFSITARPGQTVRAGDPIGVIGLSGRTEFPHLHVSFRRDGAGIDPFTGARLGEACDEGRAARGDGSLWRDKTLRYEPVALLDAGITGRKPSYKEAKAGALGGRDRITRSDPALVGWARLIGAAKGDRIRLRLVGPTGAALAARSVTLDRNRAIQFMFAGRRARGRWPAGRYRLEVELDRGGRRLIDAARTLEL